MNETELEVRKLSQRERIKAHLMEKGKITPLEALHDYGCFRLASRIAELRRSGMVISTETDPHKGYATYVWCPAFNEIEVGE